MTDTLKYATCPSKNNCLLYAPSGALSYTCFVGGPICTDVNLGRIYNRPEFDPQGDEQEGDIQAWLAYRQLWVWFNAYHNGVRYILENPYDYGLDDISEYAGVNTPLTGPNGDGYFLNVGGIPLTTQPYYWDQCNSWFGGNLLSEDRTHDMDVNGTESVCVQIYTGLKNTLGDDLPAVSEKHNLLLYTRWYGATPAADEQDIYATAAIYNP